MSEGIAGALLGTASSGSSTVQSTCPLDCPDTCSLEVQVQDGRIARVDGSSRNTITDGFICSKVRSYAEHVYGSDRLLHPLVREGKKGEGRFRQVSWDEALDRICAALARVRDQHGAEAILPFHYGGSNGALSQGSLDARLFARLGASRLERTLCAAATGAAQGGLYGKMTGVALDDFVHARLIVLWGFNPSASGIHLVPYINEALKRGAKLVVIDPRRIPLAQKAHLHLAIKPGTDLPVALALVRWLFAHGHADLSFLQQHTSGWETLKQRADVWSLERAAEVSGVPVDQLELLARWYAEASPALVRCGWGPERNRNGGSAVAAILALPAVAGKFGVRGGGYTLSNSKAIRLDDRLSTRAVPAQTRIINMSQLGEALELRLNPPIKLLFVYNCNPVATVPAQNRVRKALLREDLFTVVFDQVQTDTVPYADVVLPATTFLEHTELKQGYGSYGLWLARPAISPVGEARSNVQVFGELLRRMKLDQEGDPSSEEQLIDALLEGSEFTPQARAELLETGGIQPRHGGHPVQLVDIFPGTPDRKVHLLPAQLEQESEHGLYHYLALADDARFPLTLISPATSKAISSTLYQLHAAKVPVQLSPKDAEARGIQTGDRVRLYNEHGEVTCDAAVDAVVREGVAVLPKGLWARHTHNGATSNALIPDHVTDVGGGACYNDARVQIERV